MPASADEALAAPPPSYTMIETAKLNGIDQKAWLAHVLTRLPPMRRIGGLLP